MVDFFEDGKTYKWIGGSERPFGWNMDGFMDFLLDGKPHKVTKGYGDLASFEDTPDDNDYGRDFQWSFASTKDMFVEVK